MNVTALLADRVLPLARPIAAWRETARPPAADIACWHLPEQSVNYVRVESVNYGWVRTWHDIILTLRSLECHSVHITVQGG